jgi:hypothetical protein
MQIPLRPDVIKTLICVFLLGTITGFAFQGFPQSQDVESITIGSSSVTQLSRNIVSKRSRGLCHNESIFNLPIELHLVRFEFYIDTAEFQIKHFVTGIQYLFAFILAWEVKLE